MRAPVGEPPGFTHTGGQYDALSYLGMARGYVLGGEGSQAKDAYEKFFALWKTADPDLPVLKQARAEYAELR
jgi:hypothetical protein